MIVDLLLEFTRLSAGSYKLEASRVRSHNKEAIFERGVRGLEEEVSFSGPVRSKCMVRFYVGIYLYYHPRQYVILEVEVMI